MKAKKKIWPSSVFPHCLRRKDF